MCAIRPGFNISNSVNEVGFGLLVKRFAFDLGTIIYPNNIYKLGFSIIANNGLKLRLDMILKRLLCVKTVAMLNYICNL